MGIALDIARKGATVAESTFENEYLQALRLIERNPCAGVVLRARGAADRDSDLTERGARQTGAVEAVRPGGAPHIRLAHLGHRVCDRGLDPRSRGRSGL